jgi:hypothetical protein
MAGGEHQEKLISLFYSYSHNDEELRKRLEDHLAALRWNGIHRRWRRVGEGDRPKSELGRHHLAAGKNSNEMHNSGESRTRHGE